jgi:hypothetical protein
MRLANPDDAVLRAAGQVPAIVDACLALHSPAIWIPEGTSPKLTYSAHQTPAGQW